MSQLSIGVELPQRGPTVERFRFSIGTELPQRSLPPAKWQRMIARLVSVSIGTELPQHASND